MDVTEALEKIESSALGNTRLEALASVADVPGVKELVRLAVDDSITFGIKKIPGPPPTGKTLYEIFSVLFRSDVEWCSHLVELLDRLATRRLSGNAALEAVGGFLSKCSGVQRKWSERVLLKDLRLNLGTKDVNKAIPGLCFLFTVPLAVDYAKASEKDLRGDWIAQYKYDGARCVAYLYGNGTGLVELKSRNGKPWGNFESVRTALAEWNKDRSGPDLVIDGEVVALDENGKVNFNYIQQNMHAHKREEVGRLQYVVFDYATREQWEGREDAGKYSFRYDNAEELVFALHDDGVDEEKVVLAPVIDIATNPTPEVLRSLNMRAVADGYEGAMVRLAASPLELKRTKKLLKIKSFKDAEARVASTVEGTGKHAGRLGTLVCVTPTGVQFEIGSGFDDKTRDGLWAERKALPGREAKYKFFEVSKDGVPRFPIFLGWRHPDDK